MLYKVRLMTAEGDPKGYAEIRTVAEGTDTEVAIDNAKKDLKAGPRIKRGEAFAFLPDEMDDPEATKNAWMEGGN
jgi:hypothetical protein